ncbi:hypothetical protein ARMGADRAFT_1033067 [Armillaria gallica]|uniref:Uncharacterized protein n=1 Tax=Armillaria gallica TaxID=47427 RepID=A0A2H3D5X3_ARMGA|nr:hypothetical protein ARMGADRAFT_1033067 [Armillaria gallica]
MSISCNNVNAPVGYTGTQNIAINDSLVSPNGSKLKKSDNYTIDTLQYTEEQLQWLETHVQEFEAAGILWHLTMQLGHGWSLDAETGTKESSQIKLGILEYLHQFNDKALVTKVVD